MTPCGKRIYYTRALAKRVARTIGKAWWRAYLCPHCRFWHLTSTPRRLAAIAAREDDEQRRRDDDEALQWQHECGGK